MQKCLPLVLVYRKLIISAKMSQLMLYSARLGQYMIV